MATQSKASASASLRLFLVPLTWIFTAEQGEAALAQCQGGGCREGSSGDMRCLLLVLVERVPDLSCGDICEEKRVSLLALLFS